MKKIRDYKTLYNEIKQKQETLATPIVIAIDGPCAAGKSTLAKKLAEEIDGQVVHMDDFFLPGRLRTPARLREPGGNVHYERFQEEVLAPILAQKKECGDAKMVDVQPAALDPSDSTKPSAKTEQTQKSTKASYAIFNCKIMDFDGEQIIDLTKPIVVEGAYALHPLFGSYADMALYLDVETDVQRERLLARNGVEGAQRFFDRWIPMERHYMTDTKLKERVDGIVSLPDETPSPTQRS